MASIVSIIPIVLLFILMLGFKMAGHKSALLTLVQHGAGGVDGGGVSRRARSHDQKFHMAAFGHLAPLSRFVHEVVPHAPDCNASPPRTDVDKIVAPDGAAL